LHVERENEKEITCMDFRTAKGLTGIRLGSLLLYDMFKFALERDKHAVVYGFNVLISNTSAQKMYERFGGKFYKTKSDLDNNIFLTAEEYARSSDGVTGCVIFENKVMTEIVSRENPKLYTLQEYLHKFSPENQQSK
jgi:hypothetical protein